MPKEQANIYRQRAAECEALARHYENTPLAKYFLELAEQWRQLADQTERSESRVKRMLRLFGYKGWKGAVESAPAVAVLRFRGESGIDLTDRPAAMTLP